MGSHAELLVRIPMRGRPTAQLSADVTANTMEFRRACHWLHNELDRAFQSGSGVILQAMGTTLSVAYGEFAVAYADCTAGDTIYLKLPNGQVASLVAVASGADSAAGEWNIDTDDETTATSIAAAVNGLALTAQYLTGSSAVDGTVELTAKTDAYENGTILVWASETTSTATSLTSTPTLIGSLTNGVTPTTLAPSRTVTITIGSAPTADDTLRFGNVVLTWKASASGENQVTLNANTTTSAANLVAKVNAHSILGKLMTATNVDNVVTLTWTASGFLAYMLYMVAAGTTPGTISGQFQSTACVPAPVGSVVALNNT